MSLLLRFLLSAEHSDAPSSRISSRDYVVLTSMEQINADSLGKPDVAFEELRPGEVRPLAGSEYISRVGTPTRVPDLATDIVRNVEDNVQLFAETDTSWSSRSEPRSGPTSRRVIQGPHSVRSNSTASSLIRHFEASRIAASSREGERTNMFRLARLRSRDLQ